MAPAILAFFIYKHCFLNDNPHTYRYMIGMGFFTFFGNFTRKKILNCDTTQFQNGSI